MKKEKGVTDLVYFFLLWELLLVTKTMSSIFQYSGSGVVMVLTIPSVTLNLVLVPTSCRSSAVEQI
jgi:hypothetical protein